MGNDRYEATLNVRVGPIQSTYRAKVSIEDPVPMRSFTILVDGSGSAGFAQAKGLISLEEQEGKTLVKVQGEAQVGGTVARVGQRLMGSVNKMMMDKLFTCLQEGVSR